MAYGLFHWLDENASDEAKAALAQTMSLKDYKSEQIASALVEVFDRIYTYPLLRWRAFFRSFLFTTVVSAIFAFELARPRMSHLPAYVFWFLSLLLGNLFSDYVSLFVIRRVLIRSGTKPVKGLVLGAMSGIAVVLALQLFIGIVLIIPYELLIPYIPPDLNDSVVLTGVPIFLVFAWLPLFALGIVLARVLTPLSWIVGRTQWFLKEGKEHPLKAIGYVAAVAVFLGTVAARAVFSSTTS